MIGCSYDRVFMVPAAKVTRGWSPGNDNRYNPAPPARYKISIAWWLIPCVVVWAASVLVFG